MITWTNLKKMRTHLKVDGTMKMTWMKIKKVL